MEKENQLLQTSIAKALNPSEAPLKMKHARFVIISTHRSKGAQPFWSVITRQPIMEHRFTAWKFCHLLHKVLREGHENSLRQSQTHKTLILELGKLWGHLQDGVGKCIEAYTRFLVNKLEFHQKNANIPGSLSLDFNEFAHKVGSDLNLYFQLCVEVFDYIEHILQVQAQIFSAINTYRLSSMTPQGQCRLAPLITLIQDSNPLYDISVRIMFRLHDGLSHDVLRGHRNRFNEIFKKLKSFYDNVRPLQYFSDVIQLPHLPDVAPNFSSDELGNYRAPVMVLQREVETESFVDLTSTEDDNAQAECVLEQKELLIRQLTETLNEKQKTLEYYSNLAHQMNTIQQRNESLERELSETKEILDSAKYTKNVLELKLVEMEEKLCKMSTLEGVVEQGEDKLKEALKKFEKIKTMYSKLREDHINLLRLRNEDSKQLAADKTEVQQLNEEIKKLKEKLAESEKDMILTKSLQSKSVELENSLSSKDQSLNELNNKIHEMEQQLLAKEKAYETLTQEFEKQTIQMEADKKLLHSERLDKQQLEDEIKALKRKFDQQVSQTEEIDSSLKSKIQEYESMITNNDLTIEKLNSEISQQKEQLLKDQSEYNALAKEYEKQLKDLQTKCEHLTQNSIEDAQAKQLQLEELLSIQKNNEMSLQELQQKLISINTEKEAIAVELKSAQEQSKYLEKSKSEAFLATDNIIAAVLEAITHSLNTDFTNKVFEANLVLQQTKANMDIISKQLKNKLDIYKLHVSNNVMLTEDYVKSSITLVSALKSLQDYVTFIADNTSDMEKSQVLRSQFNNIRVSFLNVFQMMLDRSKDIPELENQCQSTDGKLEEINKVLLLMSDSFNENLNIGDLLQKELKEMDKMIEEAAQKMLEIQQNSKSKNEGIKLEVNEKILESCTNLMHCIINLIKKSRDLQKEIVAQGRGSGSEKEFYKRNSQWTEGLISASKSVAKGANYLVDAANKAIVLESNECFEIIVAAQEIAASTAQLVIASKVKANKDSQKLIDLTKASRDVSLATGSVVATVKDGCQKLEYKNEIDMTKLNTSQKKAMEIEMHIKVLQLEQALDNERQNLMAFRKKFYQTEDD